MFINIVRPQGVVDGLQVQISQKIHPLFRGVARPREDRLSYSLGLGDLIFPARFTFFHAHASLPIFLSFSVLFHSCCSHAQVFGRTLVREFPNSYSHTELYQLFPTVQLHVHIRVFGAKVEILTHQLTSCSRLINQSMMPNGKYICC